MATSKWRYVPTARHHRCSSCRPKKGKHGLTLTVDLVTVTHLFWNAPARRFDPRPPRIVPLVEPAGPVEPDTPSE